MAETVDLFVINKNGVLVDRYYLGGNKTAKFLRSVTTFTDTAGEFQVLKASFSTIKALMYALGESCETYFNSKLQEVIKDGDNGTYDDEKYWFNIVIAERR